MIDLIVFDIIAGEVVGVSYLNLYLTGNGIVIIRICGGKGYIIFCGFAVRKSRDRIAELPFKRASDLSSVCT